MNQKLINEKPKIVLIRGLPGSGKSTMAAAMSGYVHLEADMFMLVDGAYQYDPTKVRDSHEWCRKQMRIALASGQSVVVSNTFSRLHEMKDYVTIGKDFNIAVTVIDADGAWPNVHGVPLERIEQMRQRWEKLPPGYPATWPIVGSASQ